MRRPEKSRLGLSLVATLGGATLGGGCGTVPTTHRAAFEVIARSREGRPIECQVLGRGPRTILILATIHGDEAAGTPLVRRLGEYLGENPELLAGKKVVLIPAVNVDGMARRRRHNARGIDLNRNFPADNFNEKRRHGSLPLSEPESRAIVEVLREHRPIRVISVHQPLGCIDYDGPAHALARAMSRVSRIPVKKLGARPGSLGSYAGENLGIPTVTVELPANASRLSSSELWGRYGSLFLKAISYPPEIERREYRTARRFDADSLYWRTRY